MARIKGKGSILELEIASVFTAIAQLTGIDGPEAEVEDDESTALDTSGAGKTYAPTGWVEPGEVESEGLFDPVLASHQALTDLLTAPATVNWKLKFADAAVTVWPFAGHLKKLGPTIDMNKLTRFSFGIKLSGIVTYPT
jgi:hypothetical protein